MEIIRLNQEDIEILQGITTFFKKINGIISCNCSSDENFLGILFGQGWMRIEPTEEFFKKIWREIFTSENNLPQGSSPNKGAL